MYTDQCWTNYMTNLSKNGSGGGMWISPISQSDSLLYLQKDENRGIIKCMEEAHSQATQRAIPVL